MSKEEILTKDKLLESIDFFAQNLSLEQIASYGYPYIHELLSLEESAIFVLKEDTFELNLEINTQFIVKSFKNDQRMKHLATKFGRAMTKELNTYFDFDLISKNEITFAMPIIVKDDTVAVIFSKSKQFALGFEQSFIHGINQMINKAAESAINFRALQNSEAILDRKIYNLMFINHSTKALMRELNLKRLYQLCVDVISELTASSVTSFGLYDHHRNRIILKGYKDILSYKDYYCELPLCDQVILTNKVIFNVRDDFEALKKIFKSPETLETLKAEYVVLLVKDEIQGFVTIGRNINQKEYTEELLDQVESMVSSIYIAITNARYVKTIEQNKVDLSNQLEMMKHLNGIIENINSCETLEELTHITMQTIKYAFNIEKAMILLKNKDTYEVIDEIGLDFRGAIQVSNQFEALCSDEVYFDAMAFDPKEYFDGDIIVNINDTNCFVSVPLKSDVDKIYGYLVTIKSNEVLNHSQIVALEMIGHSISPMLKQLDRHKYIEEHYLVNEEMAFIDDLKKAMNNRLEFYVDFKVFFKELKTKPFEKVDLSEFEGLKVFYFNQVVFHIDYDERDEDDRFDGAVNVEDLESFIEEIQNIIR
ncbi:MAG: GAF domain-containing protein [Clostridia bacterium]|nr:GAF domain-containing protein [Clostridia bacterium]